MTEHTDKVNERRFQLFKEETNYPTIEGIANTARNTVKLVIIKSLIRSPYF